MVQNHVLDWASVFIRNMSNQPNLFIRSVSECSFDLIVVKAPDKLFWIGLKTDPIMMKMQPKCMNNIYCQNSMLEYCIILKKSPDSYFTQSKEQLI